MGGLPPSTQSVAPLWRNRNFMLLWSGQTISVFGSTISDLAFPLLVLALTGSPAQTGLVLALEAVPFLVFSLPVGAWVDRWNRKKVMILCNIGNALTLASIPFAMASLISFWSSHCSGSGRSFSRNVLSSRATFERIFLRDFCGYGETHCFAFRHFLVPD